MKTMTSKTLDRPLPDPRTAASWEYWAAWVDEHWATLNYIEKVILGMQYADLCAALLAAGVVEAVTAEALTLAPQAPDLGEDLAPLQRVHGVLSAY